MGKTYDIEFIVRVSEFDLDSKDGVTSSTEVKIYEKLKKLTEGQGELIKRQTEQIADLEKRIEALDRSRITE